MKTQNLQQNHQRTGVHFLLPSVQVSNDLKTQSHINRRYNLENVNFQIICTFIKVGHNNKKSQQEHRNVPQCALIKFFFLAKLEVAYHADVLSGAGTRHEPDQIDQSLRSLHVLIYFLT